MDKSPVSFYLNRQKLKMHPFDSILLAFFEKERKPIVHRMFQTICYNKNNKTNINKIKKRL